MADPAKGKNTDDHASSPSEPVIGQTWPGGSSPPLAELMTTHPKTGERGIFIFGYGSLVANAPPGQTERHDTHITGFRRDFAVQDIFYRGTKAEPGLTLGLDPHEGGKVPGAVYFAPEASAQEMLTEVLKQETPRGMEDIYQRRVVETGIEGGHKVPALAFVANPDSKLYVGDSMSMDEKAAKIARSYGIPNNDYAKRNRSGMTIGKTDLEYLAMTSLRLEESGNGDAYLSDLTELAVQKREAMIHSDDKVERMKAEQLSRMEVGTKVEAAFSDRIGSKIAAAAVADMGLPQIMPSNNTLTASGLGKNAVVVPADKLNDWRRKRAAGAGLDATPDPSITDPAVPKVNEQRQIRRPGM